MAPTLVVWVWVIGWGGLGGQDDISFRHIFRVSYILSNSWVLNVTRVVVCEGSNFLCMHDILTCFRHGSDNPYPSFQTSLVGCGHQPQTLATCITLAILLGLGCCKAMSPACWTCCTQLPTHLHLPGCLAASWSSWHTSNLQDPGPHLLAFRA